MEETCFGRHSLWCEMIKLQRLFDSGVLLLLFVDEWMVAVTTSTLSSRVVQLRSVYPLLYIGPPGSVVSDVPLVSMSSTYTEVNIIM